MKNALSFLWLLLTLQVAAQQPESRQKIFNIQRSGLYATCAMHISDYADVNAMLSDSGYEKFNTTKFTMGFGFTARTHRVITNLEYFLFSQCNVTPSFQCSHIDFASYGVSLGYDVTKNQRFDLYPFVGLNRNRTDILLSYVNFPDMPFQTFLLNYSNVARVTRVNYSLNLGASFDYFIPFSKKYSSEIILGIYGGYYLQVTESTWFMHVDELPLTQAPRTNPGGVYLKLKAGICF